MIDWTNANVLPWLIPIPPLIAFFLIFLVTNRSWWLTVVTALTGTALSWLMAIGMVLRSIGAAFGEAVGEGAFSSQVPWMATGGSEFNIGVLVDPLTAVMLFMVPLTIAMIMIYSVGYIYHDPRRERFMGYMSLFAAAMLTLVVADNLLLLFIGWEVMGFCSYALIGFWFEKESAHRAGVKAFMTTRVADVIMLLGIAYLFAQTGTLSFRDIFFSEETLRLLAETPALLFGSLGISAAGLIGTFLFMGTVGKSAQFPLHVWLPDAMEGPTPVSAMIHAAAMVSAGVYMVIRMYPLLSTGADPHHGVYGVAGLTNPTLPIMAFLGAFTALFAAVIAIAQNDIKRVLAYSTISQLGYMVAALGIGAYVAAAFHLITHGIFKALLFMSSGSVIHAMEHGQHHVHEHGHHDEHAEPFDPNDMRLMGGLRSRIPVTWVAFLAGGMALAGFPLLTAGFWSKDEILAEAWGLGFVDGIGPAIFVFIFLVLGAFLTAFYTMRQLALTFGGWPRTGAAEHASLGGTGTLVSSWMQVPLAILAVFAIIAGFVGVHPGFPILGAVFSPFGNPFHNFVVGSLPEHLPTLAFNLVPVLFSFVVALGGLWLGYRMYWQHPVTAGQEDPAKTALDKISPALWQWMERKFYVDELYDWAFVRPSQWFSDVLIAQILDRGIIDGILHTIGRVAVFVGELFKRFNRVVIDGVGDGIPYAIGWFGRWFRLVQGGGIQGYLLMVAMSALLIGFFVWAIFTGSQTSAIVAILVVLVVIVVLGLISRILGGMTE